MPVAFILTRRCGRNSRFRDHRLVAEARRSLRAIRRYIAQDSDFYAARMVIRIIERVERAALAPSQGHPVHEYPEQPLKEVHESPYRII